MSSPSCRNGVIPGNRSERGAILIFVAIGVFVLTAFLVFVLDDGVLLLSRRQAQNAADAGAMAGAIARFYDEPADPPSSGGAAYQSAFDAAQANTVMGAAPGVAVSWECPPFSPEINGVCVRVDTHRDGTNNSTVLPVYFAALFGMTSQSVRATATAQLLGANGSGCLKPFFLPDLFVPGVPYQAPGYTTDMAGTQIILNPGDPSDTIAPGNYFESDLTGGGGGTNEYTNSIRTCVDVEKYLGDPMQTLPGRRPVPTANAIQDLIDADLGASVDSEGYVTGSCVGPPNSCPSPYQNYARSPRVGVIALFDPTIAETERLSGNLEWPIVNFIAVFFESVVHNPAQDAGRVTATILAEELGLRGPGPTPDPTAAFLRYPSLVR